MYIIVKLILSVLLISLIALTSGVRQEFTFYDRSRFNAEDSITLTRHYPNITGTWDFFLKAAQGRCVRGDGWVTYLAENYQNIYFRMINCANIAEGYFGNVKSLRYVAASESTTKAISFNEDDRYQGREFFWGDIKKEDGVEFQVNSLATSGNSNWALYEGANFTGRRVFIPGGDQEVFMVGRLMQDYGIQNVRSFERIDL